jgi:N-formylglutamate amidohydrolase
VLNGRFKGGFITRHYGIPSTGVQVVQLEMAQRIYMDEAAPGVFEGGRAAGLVDVLQRVVGAMIAAARS